MAPCTNKPADKTKIISPLYTVRRTLGNSYLYVALMTGTHGDGAYDSTDDGFCHSPVNSYVCVLMLFHALASQPSVTCSR